MDKVCTIIVTYNGGKWIEKCMQHLLASQYPSKIIIVDNHSTDNTLDLLERYLDKIELIKSEKNLGFGQGNNIGMKRALELDVSFIFLLNQDAYISPDCIKKLINVLRKNPSFGVVSPLQLDSSGLQLDKAFKKYIHKENLERVQLDSSSRPIPLRFVNAAAWMISKVAIKKVGLFHPVFFHYGEDNHYSSRLQYHHLHIGVSTITSIIHDRNKEIHPPEKLLLRNLKTIPLYTLLDIRKPLPIAYLLGLNKLKRIKKKLWVYHLKGTRAIYLEQKSWFTTKLKEAIQIRKETKQIYQK